MKVSGAEFPPFPSDESLGYFSRPLTRTGIQGGVMRDELKRRVNKVSRRREVGWHPLVAGSTLARDRSFILHPAALLILFTCLAPLLARMSRAPLPGNTVDDAAKLKEEQQESCA